MARIMLVDDDQSALEMLRRGLEAEGHAVTAISESRDALDIVTSDPGLFDLLITDISMPDIDGVSLASGVLAVRPQLPVIMMSGLADELKRADTLRADHGVRILSKPLSLDQVRAEVAAALAR